MNRRALAVLLIVLAAAAVTAAQKPDAPKADAPKPPPPARREPEGAGGVDRVGDPDFAGKIVVVWVKEPIKGGVLQNVRVRRVGGRAFVVGEYAKLGKDDEDVAGLHWFPVADIQLISEYKSLDEARKAYEEREKADK